MITTATVIFGAAVMISGAPISQASHITGHSGLPDGGVVSDGVPATTARTIASVPAYSWYHGCGPTSAASVLGYWDLNGFPHLFDAVGNDVFLTVNVQDHISSPEHNAKYDTTPDAAGPDPDFTSIADWFRTSMDPWSFGSSSLSLADNAFEGYAAHRGYEFEAQTMRFDEQSSAFSFNWNDFAAEIESDRPVMFMVDVDGSGWADHFVPALGYDNRGSDGRFYGFFTSWSEDEAVIWKPFLGGNAWGVQYAVFVTPVAEPSNVVAWLFIFGIVVFVRRHGFAT